MTYKECYDQSPEVLQKYLTYCKAIKGLSEKTISEYFLDLRMFIRYLKADKSSDDIELDDSIDIKSITLTDIQAIRKSDIISFLNYLRTQRKAENDDEVGVMPKTAIRKMASLKTFFRYLCDYTEEIPRNPTIGIELPKTNKTLPKYLTEQESLMLLNQVNGLNAARDYCIILICLTVGLRVSEVRGINLSDLRFEQGSNYLKVTGKGNKQREVYLTDICIDAIKDYILVRDEYAPEGEDAEKALFLSRKHKRMSVDSIQYLMDHICKKAGIEHYSPHKLRHTAATIMVNNGADIMEIKEVLGHENVQTSTIYSHLSQQNLDVVVSKCGFNNTLEKAKKQERKNRSKEDPKK